MKKKLLGILTVLAVSVQMSAVFAEKTAPTIIVNEREMYFADQGPVIQEKTGRTLIPLRAVLEECNAKVEWDAETRTIHATAGDNRREVTLTIDSDQMKTRYYQSLMEFTDDTVTLDEPAQIMNDRTMIPVRAVVEALGSKVDWDEDSQVINITSRAYMRYLMDQGVLDSEFKPIEKKEGEKVYDASKELPALSLTSKAQTVAEGESFDVYVNLNNLETLGGEKRLFTGCSLGIYYDSDVLNYDGYTFVDGEEEYRAVLDASNAEFKGNSVKIVSIAHYGNEEQETKDGAIMKLTFKVKKAEKTELRLSNRLTDLGYDTYFTIRVDDKDITCTDATQLYIDTAPVIINQ